MKTYVFNLPKQLKHFNQKLDVSALLCGKSWQVFNDEGVKQIFVFKSDNTLINSINGSVSRTQWEYIPANKSLIIGDGNNEMMLHPAFIDDVIFALKKDGVEEYFFLINENSSVIPERTITALYEYFVKRENDFQQINGNLTHLNPEEEDSLFDYGYGLY